MHSVENLMIHDLCIIIIIYTKNLTVLCQQIYNGKYYKYTKYLKMN